jgi:hypothetical protein
MMIVWYTWKNSAELLEPSSLLINLGLNLLGHVTYLSPGARARSMPLPDGVAAHAGEHRGGDNILP